MNTSGQKQLTTIEMRYLRKAAGVTKRDSVRNYDIMGKK